LRSPLLTEFNPSVRSWAYTDRLCPSVTTDEMLRIKKKGGSLMWRLFLVLFSNGITEGFKTAAPYGDETGSPMKNANGITEGFKMAALYGDVSYLPSE